MQKKYLLLVVFLVFVVATMVACEGSDENGDGDIDGDADGDTPDGDADGDEDGDEPDGDEDGDEPDGDEPDGDIDGDTPDGDVDGDETDGDEDGDAPVCDCDMQSDCCDGCNYINEGGNCDDGNACTQSDSCASGVCVGADPVACEALDDCHVAGECDPATGNCSNPNEQDFIECAADDGPDGSGYCSAGECLAYAACLVRYYNQAANMPCNVDLDCESRFCYDQTLTTYKRMDYRVCSQSCNEYPFECPEGMFCGFDSEYAQYVCQPVSSPEPGDASRQMYEPCNFDEDCASGQCIPDTYGLYYCSDSCDASKADCGDCGFCGPMIYKEKAEYFCQWDGGLDYGELCTQDKDCISALCFENHCAQPCSRAECPADTTCADAGAHFGEICLPDAEIGLVAKHGSCTYNYECEGDLICTATPDPDIYWHLIKGNTKMSALAHARIGYLSMETWQPLLVPETGDYEIVLGGEGAYAVGEYEFSILTEDGTPVAIEEQEYNNQTQSAQRLELPFTLHGFAQNDAGEDHFIFHAEQRTPLLIHARVLPKVGTCELPAQLGEPCTYSRECEGELTCHQAVSFCTQSCTLRDANPCPTDFACVDIDRQLMCYPESELGFAFGEACSFDDQCESGVCLEGACNLDCGMPIKDGLCPDNYSCVDTDDSEHYVAYRCLPDNTIALGFGETCTNNYQCESGYCIEGGCSQVCLPVEVSKADPCPQGSECVPYTYPDVDFGFCLPEGDYERAFGAACDADYQCGSEYCFEGFCNDHCTPEIKDGKGPTLCPADYRCAILAYDTACIATADLLAVGDTCEEDWQCDSERCSYGQCTKLCNPGIAEPDCPQSSTCIAMDKKVTPGYCLDNDSLNQPIDGPCENSVFCEQGLYCYAGKCTKYCGMFDFRRADEDCPEGYACVPPYTGSEFMCIEWQPDLP